MIREIRIGTRGSLLAVRQAEIIAREISRSWPELVISLVKIRTSGDMNMSAFVNEAPGVKGLFTRELEDALLRHEIDFAVHSLKDLPVQVREDLPLVAYSHRGDVRDALLLSSAYLPSLRSSEGGRVGVNNGFSYGEQSCFTIGSSSLRRRLQLERLFPNVKIIPVRGNINTRLRKLDESQELSGLVLAAAGLGRLGLGYRITRFFGTDEILPAPGQGILACQGRRDEDYSYLDCLNDADSRDCALAERSFSCKLNAGCNVPVGAYAQVSGEELTLDGLFIDESSRKFYRGTLSGKRKDAISIGKTLSEVIFS